MDVRFKANKYIAVLIYKTEAASCVAILYSENCCVDAAILILTG